MCLPIFYVACLYCSSYCTSYELSAGANQILVILSKDVVTKVSVKLLENMARIGLVCPPSLLTICELAMSHTQT
jgi:hypothetical protein